MGEQTIGRVKGWTDLRVDGLTIGRAVRWIIRQLDGRMDRR
jgi:hypothetical protein